MKNGYQPKGPKMTKPSRNTPKGGSAGKKDDGMEMPKRLTIKDNKVNLTFVRIDEILNIIDAEAWTYIDWLNNRAQPDHGYHAATVTEICDRIRDRIMELGEDGE